MGSFGGSRGPKVFTRGGRQPSPSFYLTAVSLFFHRSFSSSIFLGRYIFF
jgi:hypothetical protein